MGEAKRRGTFEERRSAAIKAKHTKSGWWREHGGLSKRARRLALRAMRGGMARFSKNKTEA